MKLVMTTDERQHERRRIALLCIDLIFARTHIPMSVVEKVREVAVRYGIGAGIEMAAAVLRAFEAGHAWGEHDANSEKGKR
jgi:hypothetical protein